MPRTVPSGTRPSPFIVTVLAGRLDVRGAAVPGWFNGVARAGERHTMHMPRVGLVLMSALLLSSCATAQLLTTWQAPGVTGVRFTRVLVVAMVKNESRRRAVEDRMVADIQRLGVFATPSYLVSPGADPRDVDVVRAAVLQGGFDGAVTWRTIAVSDVTHSVPTGLGFWGYFGYGWTAEFDPGYLQTDRTVRVETMVYSVTSKNDRLIWSGISESVDPNSLDGLVDGVADATVASMRTGGMFAVR